MKNFLRALRHAWPYRRRLIISALAALFAAVLWGGNFTSIYPVLKLLHTGESMHQWVDSSIASTQKDIDCWQANVDRLSDQQKELEKQRSSKSVQKQQRDNSSDLLRLENKLQS